MPVKLSMSIAEGEHTYISDRAHELGVSWNGMIRAMIHDMNFLEARSPEDGSVFVRNGASEELSEMRLDSLRTPRIHLEE